MSPYSTTVIYWQNYKLHFQPFIPFKHIDRIFFKSLEIKAKCRLLSSPWDLKEDRRDISNIIYTFSQTFSIHFCKSQSLDSLISPVAFLKGIMWKFGCKNFNKCRLWTLSIISYSNILSVMVIFLFLIIYETYSTYYILLESI